VKTKLILDYSKWRCGYEGEHKLGEGQTLLLNEEGYMCCLGQFARQLNGKITNSVLLHKGEPGDIVVEIPNLNLVRDYGSSDEADFQSENTSLSDNAIEINDEAGTTPEEKIGELKKLFGDYNYEIEVINKP
jgi:hypothetical protein